MEKTFFFFLFFILSWAKTRLKKSFSLIFGFLFICVVAHSFCLQMFSRCFQVNVCLLSTSLPQTLLEFAGRWSLEEEPLPLLEVYIVALLSYVEASPFLSPQCENVQLVVERLSL